LINNISGIAFALRNALLKYMLFMKKLVSVVLVLLLIILLVTSTQAQALPSGLKVEVVEETTYTVTMSFHNTTSENIDFKPYVSLNNIVYSRVNNGLLVVTPLNTIEIVFTSTEEIIHPSEWPYKVTVTIDCQGQGINCWSYEYEIRNTLPATPLPVKLVSFKVNRNGVYNHLSWQTASEKDSEHFEVQRSKDGIAYTSIAKVSSAGYSYAALNYGFNDYNSGVGLIYYRLKMVDTDGSYEFSRPQSINIRGEQLVNYYGFTIRQDETPLGMFIFDTSGKLIQEIKITDLKNEINYKKGQNIIMLLTDKGRYNRKFFQI
jgi:hypothetical protein